MSLKKLYIFVEGQDDEFFFRRIIVPALKPYYDDIDVIQYAQMKKSKVDLFVLSIETLNFDYLMFADIDEMETTFDKKRFITGKFLNVRKEKLLIVIREIESWYLAGLSNKKAEEFHLEPFGSTDDVTKEEFNLVYQRIFHSRIDFMQELIKCYSIESAREKNRSFNYFFSSCVDKLRDRKR